MISDKDIPVLFNKLRPFIARYNWQNGQSAQASGAGGVAAHSLYGAAHTGTLDRSQAPWVSSDIATAIATHNTVGDPHSQYVHVSVARTISASHNFAHATIGFTSPDADSYFFMGRAFTGYAGGADAAAFGHRDYRDLAECAISQDANGDTTLGGFDVIHHSVNGADQMRVSAGLVEFDNTSDPTLRTANYASQTTGWALTYDGALDVRYLYADEMHVKAFIADLEQALAGGQIICKSVAKLSDTFTVPSYSGSAQLNVESFPGWPNAHVFVNGDTIGIKIISRTDGTPTSAGSLVIGWVFGTVVFSHFSVLTKTQTWTFTRLSSSLINGSAAGGTASGGTVVEAGAIALDFGTTGNGYYEVNAIDGQMAVNSPYSQTVTWNTHPVYDRTVRTREGNLTGLGFTGQYGLYALGADANQYIVASGSGITVRNTTISQYDGSNNLRGQWDTLTGVDLKALGDISWGLTAGLHDMSISALQNYSFSDSSTIFGGVAAGKGSTRDRVVLYNQQYDVDKEAHVVVDARFIDSNNPNTYNRSAKVTIATSRWFPGMGVQHNAYIELQSANGNVDTISMVADSATATMSTFAVSGKVGAGSGTAPTYTLQVTSGGTTGLAVDGASRFGQGGQWGAIDAPSSGWIGFGANFYYSGTQAKYRATNYASMMFCNDAVHFYTAGSGSADANISWSEKVVIENAGNVGIGVSTTETKLHVAGTIRARSGSGGIIQLHEGDASNIGYIEWYTAAGTRQGYMGYGSSNVSLVLENSAAFVVSGGDMQVNGAARFAGGYVGLAEAAEPATSAAYAYLYADSADGDLKVKFKNGTVKTLATN